MAKGGSSASDSQIPSTFTANTIFIDTNINTHLAIMISDEDTVLDFKQKIMSEHLHCFPDIGEVKIEALKVKRKAHFYHLVNSMLVKSVFDRVDRAWFLHVDVVPNQVVPMGKALYLEPGVGNLPNGIAVMDGPSDERKKCGSKKRKDMSPDYIVKETSQMEPAAKKKRTNDKKFISSESNIVEDLSKKHESGPVPSKTTSELENVLPQNPVEEAPQQEIIEKKKPKNVKKRKPSLSSPGEDPMEENDVGISQCGKETFEQEKLLRQDPMKENDVGTSISMEENNAGISQCGKETFEPEKLFPQELMKENVAETSMSMEENDVGISQCGKETSEPEKLIPEDQKKENDAGTSISRMEELLNGNSLEDQVKTLDVNLSIKPMETPVNKKTKKKKKKSASHLGEVSALLSKETAVNETSIDPSVNNHIEFDKESDAVISPKDIVLSENITNFSVTSEKEKIGDQVQEVGQGSVPPNPSHDAPRVVLVAETFVTEANEVSRLAVEVDEDGGKKVESENYVSEKVLPSGGRKSVRVKKGEAASENVSTDHKIKKKPVNASVAKPKSSPDPPKGDLVGLEDIMPSNYLKVEGSKKIKKSRSRKQGLVKESSSMVEAEKDNGVIRSSQIPFDTLEDNVNRKPHEQEANSHIEAPIMDGDEVNFKKYFVPTPDHLEVVSPAIEPVDKLVQYKTPVKKLKANNKKKMKKGSMLSEDTIAGVQKSLGSNEDQGYKMKRQDTTTDAVHGPLLKDEQSQPAPQPNVNVVGGMIAQRDNVEPPPSKVSRVKRVDASKSNLSVDAHLVHSFVGANAKPSKTQNSVAPVESILNMKRSVHRGQKTKGYIEFESPANHRPVDVRNSLLATSNTIFEDSSSSESIHVEGGTSDSELSTRSPSDYSSSSELSKGESAGNGSYGGRIMEDGIKKGDKSLVRDMPLEDILRSSRSYKKAKLTASQSQAEDTEEDQPIEFVLDSQF